MIKSTIQETKSEPKSEYPCLKWHELTKSLVLFIYERTGVAVNDGGYNHLGEYCEEWAEEDFTPFNGTITLENS